MRPLYTVKLNNGAMVLGQLYKGEPMAIGYANRTQAERRAASLGDGWTVVHWGRPFYVRNLTAEIAEAKAEVQT